MRVLVTGGAGFIGSYLVRALLQQHNDVYVFDCASHPHLLDAVKDNITYIQGDSACDTDLYRAMAQHKIEGVFHMGALMAGVCEKKPAKAFQVNFRSTQVLLDAALTVGAKRFFFMSSISLFSPSTTEPVPEDAPKNPLTIYGQTKLASEHLLNWYADNHGLDVRGIRPTWVWGPHRTNGLTAQYTTALVQSIMHGGHVHIENPKERGDWIYIHDTIQAILLVWNAQHPKRRFYTVGGGVHTIQEVAELTRKYAPQTHVTYAEQGHITSPYACSFDDTAIRQELGYTTQWPIEKAVQDYIAVTTPRADSL